MATATTSKRDEIWICDIGFASPLGDCAPGAHLRGDDPLIAAYGDKFFSVLGTPEHERHHELDQVLAQHEQQGRDLEAEKHARFLAAAADNKVKLQAPLHVKATRDFTATIDGVPTTVLKGSTVLEGSELALANPLYFS